MFWNLPDDPVQRHGAQERPMCASTRKHRFYVAIDVDGGALLVWRAMIDTFDAEGSARQLARSAPSKTLEATG
jgi:hypothetical protein